MKKAAQVGKALSFLLLLSLFIAIIYAAILWARTPRHAGKPIQYWFAQAEKQSTGNFTLEQMNHVEHAFEQMGAAALPFLLDQYTRYKSPKAIRRIELLLRIKSKRWIPQPIKDLLPNPYTLNSHYTADRMLHHMANRGTFAQAELEQIISRPGPLGGSVDYQVLRQFEKIGEKASNSAPIIARFFNSTNTGTQLTGLGAFVAVTPSNSPHATLLREALATEKIRAAHALPHFHKWNFSIEPFLPRLGEELCSTNSNIHSDAFMTIKRLNLQSEVILPYFARAITDPDRRYRAQLLKELRAIGPPAAETIPHILQYLDDDYSFVRVEAIKTLQALQPDLHRDPELLAKIKSKLSDPVPHVAETAQATLQSTTTPSPH